MWGTLERTLAHGPDLPGRTFAATGLLLGRIQSGKTTAMSGLAALAHDKGYRLVIAILGSTNLLLSQNTTRMLRGLGQSDDLRSDYSWVHLDPTLERQRLGAEIQGAIESDRTAFVTVLKHSRRLQTLADQLGRLDLSETSVLVLDDEGDQASLNTLVAQGRESPTYRAIGDLADALPSHLYLQVTATPFAPLLLESNDRLSPSFVEFLEPGAGYTGAREFFIDHGDEVIRLVSAGEALSQPPAMLPIGLRQALANYLLGAAHLLATDPLSAPVSMLVHPTHLVAIHERVTTLIRREIDDLRTTIGSIDDPRQLPEPYLGQYRDLLRWGLQPTDGDRLMTQLRRVLQLIKIWTVNSAADQDSIRWAMSPAHILVGGNKLDRGFTVEGLTVTYLSRQTSVQADTLAQRLEPLAIARNTFPTVASLQTAQLSTPSRPPWKRKKQSASSFVAGSRKVETFEGGAVTLGLSLEMVFSRHGDRWSQAFPVHRRGDGMYSRIQISLKLLADTTRTFFRRRDY